MKNNWEKTLVILISIVVIILIGFIIFKNKRISELENEINDLKVNNAVDNNSEESNQNNDINAEDDEERVVVNSVVDAIDNVTLGDVLVLVNDNKVKIGDVSREINDEKVINVTGYYYQSGASYCVFALTENKNVYVLAYDKANGIGDKQFKKIDITNIDKLHLYDVEVYAKSVGQVDERNRVYAVIGENEQRIDSYCVRYDELNG